MKMPKYLSPTSIATFKDDRAEFYCKYLADNRPPKIPQSLPMAAGAAFDAYVKSFLVKELFGPTKMEPRFELQAIFETQVEPQNRDWAIIHGQYLFDCYKKSGALADLMLELSNAMTAPRFEFEVEGRVAHESVTDGIPLLGKPDVYFTSKSGKTVIRDWKVNGYCSTNPTSPKKQYIMSRDGWDHLKFPMSRSHRQQHKDAQILKLDGILVNCACNLETIDPSWAAQLAIYGWVLGMGVGDKFLVGIEQLVASGTADRLIRVSSYCNHIGKEFQLDLLKDITDLWNLILAVHKGEAPFFDGLSLEDSKARCESLDGYYLAFADAATNPTEKWFADISREEK
jgi:hypothetical protein